MNEAKDSKHVKLPAEYEAEQQKKSSNIDRRRFMNYTGWLGILGSLGIALLGFLRFLFPRVLFEPRTEFKAGNPSDYAVGAVDTRYLNSERVYIVREEGEYKDWYVLMCYDYGDSLCEIEVSEKREDLV